MARNSHSRCNGKAHKSTSKAARIESNRSLKQTAHLMRHPADTGMEKPSGPNKAAQVKCCICGKNVPYQRATHATAGVFCSEHFKNPHMSNAWEGVKLAFPDGYRETLPAGA